MLELDLKDFKYKLTVEEIVVKTNEDITTNVNKEFNKLLEENIIKLKKEIYHFLNLEQSRPYIRTNR